MPDMGLVMKEAAPKAEKPSSAEVNAFFSKHKSKYRDVKS